MRILTANRLSDGAAVYLSHERHWAEAPEAARLLQTPDEAKAAEAQGIAAEAALEVVGSYLMDVVLENGRIRPKSTREHIRAAGPSVRLDLGKQAA